MTMVTFNLPENPKTWLERLLTDETSEKLDTIHPEVVDLFKIPNADKIAYSHGLYHQDINYGHHYPIPSQRRNDVTTSNQ